MYPEVQPDETDRLTKMCVDYGWKQRWELYHGCRYPVVECRVRARGQVYLYSYEVAPYDTDRVPLIVAAMARAQRRILENNAVYAPFGEGWLPVADYPYSSNPPLVEVGRGDYSARAKVRDADAAMAWVGEDLVELPFEPTHFRWLELAPAEAPAVPSPAEQQQSE